KPYTFARPTTPCSIIIIDDTPVGSSPVPSSPHSHNEACQEFTDFDDSLSHHP
ncbi:hypothetical protein O181_022577, partial [Austropuccinia psidii MF-1]|nr:hypothetical protein [Austropuccinia psidii MF-1]